MQVRVLTVTRANLYPKVDVKIFNIVREGADLLYLEGRRRQNLEYAQTQGHCS